MKYIKVEGCHDCDIKEIRYNPSKCEYYYCEKAKSIVDPDVSNKTIHPDCPLPDMEEQGSKVYWENRAKQSRIDTTKFLKDLDKFEKRSRENAKNIIVK